MITSFFTFGIDLQRYDFPALFFIAIWFRAIFLILIFAKKLALVRIVHYNDWVVFVLAGCIFLYIFMLFFLQRESSVKDFLQQKFIDSSNNFLSWLIISLVFIISLTTFVSQYIPVVPQKVSNQQFLGYELNKFGFTLVSVIAFYLIKIILGYLFYAGTGSYRKWGIFYFTSSKFYFCASVVLMIFCVITYIYDVDKIKTFDFFAGSVMFLFVFKLVYYFFHKNNILPEKWYYKILYICTLQILPVLVLWKTLFF